MVRYFSAALSGRAVMKLRPISLSRKGRLLLSAVFALAPPLFATWLVHAVMNGHVLHGPFGILVNRPDVID